MIEKVGQNRKIFHTENKPQIFIQILSSQEKGTKLSIPYVWTVQNDFVLKTKGKNGIAFQWRKLTKIPNPGDKSHH